MTDDVPERLAVALHPEAPPEVRAELLALVRLGAAFRAQQRGRKPGFLRCYIAEIVARLERATFAALLLEMELEAQRREFLGEHASPVERIDRTWELAVLHHPRRGRMHVPFGTLRNLLTLAKSLQSRGRARVDTPDDPTTTDAPAPVSGLCNPAAER